MKFFLEPIQTRKHASLARKVNTSTGCIKSTAATAAAAPVTSWSIELPFGQLKTYYILVYSKFFWCTLQLQPFKVLYFNFYDLELNLEHSDTQLFVFCFPEIQREFWFSFLSFSKCLYSTSDVLVQLPLDISRDKPPQLVHLVDILPWPHWINFINKILQKMLKNYITVSRKGGCKVWGSYLRA